MTGSPSRQTINDCIFNGLMIAEPGKLIGTKLSFLMNHDSICTAMMAAFVLDGEPCHPQYFTERHSDITPRLMQDNARPHVAKTVRNFCSAQHMQLLLWPAYSPDMSPIEHVWDLVGRRLACDPRPAAAKDEFLLHIQAIWNSLSLAHIQNLFDFMSRHVAALIAARGGYTKY
ncbi:transposable element Tcb2 transposase [Trichonephila clavipes]|nr:transposable element Tcb2 transposase [Trichonephila clavipes]